MFQRILQWIREQLIHNRNNGIGLRLCFIRFGKIPSSGRSMNYLMKKSEMGISVYEAIERNGNYMILMPSLTGSACVTLSGELDNPMYEVCGQIVGIGSDGEPLLSNCRIIKEIIQVRDSQGWT